MTGGKSVAERLRADREEFLDVLRWMNNGTSAYRRFAEDSRHRLSGQPIDLWHEDLPDVRNAAEGVVHEIGHAIFLRMKGLISFVRVEQALIGKKEGVVHELRILAAESLILRDLGFEGVDSWLPAVCSAQDIKDCYQRVSQRLTQPSMRKTAERDADRIMRAVLRYYRKGVL